ncbi:PRTRC system protein C [Deinococcus ficus]|uniref:PRTRC system protein C n=1 Tax=Deinococcus ficus TaxID=317577 RepID=A0A221T2W0_9DEIO|nr:PRTRC system protein C [Deinococcus ficus]ASN83232.1 hypothetical protein DFI_18720 [Deinococcus ficus]
MIVTPTERVLKYKGSTLTDLNPSASVSDVLKMHAATRPELLNAQVEGPTLEDGRNVYTVNPKATYKG